MAPMCRCSSMRSLVLTLQLLVWIVLETFVSGGFKADNRQDAERSNENTPNLDNEIVPNPEDAAAVKAAFETFKMQKGKSYESADVEHVALKAVSRNVRDVSEHNRLFATGERSYAKRLHEYSDWTLCEIQKKLQGLDEPPNIPASERAPATNFSDSSYFNVTLESVGSAKARRQAPAQTLDYRNNGYVTAVKNQAGALEGQYFRVFGKLVDVSMQNLIDCSGPPNNFGCNGGWPMKAFDYVTAAGGIMSQAAYPFTAKAGQPCKFNKANVIPNLKVAGGKYTPAGDEAALLEAVRTIGPIAVGISSSSWGFINYSRGVFKDNSCSQKIDHAVLIVGYGTENGVGYWLVKNSWGTNWGLSGYIKMARNNNNQCGIASFGQYPIIQGR